MLKIPLGKGAGRQPAFLCPVRALVEKQPLFLPCETPLWCLEDPTLPERKGVVLTPALEWEEGASGKLGKTIGQSTVGSPRFREAWQDPW